MLESRLAELKKDWKVVAKDHVDSRMVYIFESSIELWANAIQVRVTVSSTFADPDGQAWKVLDIYVK